MRRLRDRRLWLGLAVTALALWFAFRDVSWPELRQQLARANWWLLLGASLPAYAWSIQLRAQRWCVLARGVADVPGGAAFRATAVGFLVNNLLPLRIGELVRVWWLAREIRSSVPALLGTWMLERVIDAVFLLGLAALVIGSQVGRGLLLGAALGPLLATLALRRWPGPALRGCAARGRPRARAGAGRPHHRDRGLRGPGPGRAARREGLRADRSGSPSCSGAWPR